MKRLLERDYEANLPAILVSRAHRNGDGIGLQNYHEQAENEQVAGFLGHTMQIVYQVHQRSHELLVVIFDSHSLM